jgi:hypothetical protein
VGARLVGPVENDPHVVDHLGKPTLVFLGFTFRPDVCPTTLSELSSRLKELGRDADRLNILFITVDPERDTPEKFAIYLSSFDSRITGCPAAAQVRMIMEPPPSSPQSHSSLRPPLLLRLPAARPLQGFDPGKGQLRVRQADPLTADPLM